MIKNQHNIKLGGFLEIWQIAYPLILVNASNVIMQFVDRKFLSMNSTVDVAAALPGGILCFTLFSFFTVTTGFSSAIVSQYNGRNDHEACSRVPWASFYYALFAGLVCSYLMPFLGNYVISAGGHLPEIISREKQYFNVMIATGGFTCIMIAFCSFFSGRGKTLVVAGIMLSSCGLNCILDYIFIFGKFGFPALGITGAGFATTLSAAFGALLAFIVFIFQNQKKYPTRKGLFFKFSDLKRLVMFGSPSGFQVCFDVGAFTFVIFVIGRLGEAPLAATTIALSINMIAFMPLLGMSEATGIITAKYIGYGRKDISEKQAYKALLIAICYIVVVSLVFVVFPDYFFRIFSPENEMGNFSEVMKHGRAILACAAAYNFFDAIYFISIGVLRGAGDTRFPMYVVISCAWCILVPGILLCVFVFKLSIVGIWVYIAIYIAIVCSIIFRRFRSGKWKKIDLIEKIPYREDGTGHTMDPVPS